MGVGDLAGLAVATARPRGVAGMTLLATSVGPSALWYTARSSGLVLLGLLTINLVLGIGVQARWRPAGWPRFVVQNLHRNVALLAGVLLVIHVVTVELDPFVKVGWWAALVPFVSAYRPLWLGLGTLSLDLLLAIVISSLLRGRIRASWWRAIHWLTYLSWPVALLHALGTGTDTRWSAVFIYEMLCVGLVVAAVIVRIVRATNLGSGRRTVLVTGAAAAPLAVLIWSAGGPLQPGWAKTAGTPTAALSSGGPSSGASSAGSSSAQLESFSAPFRGTLSFAGSSLTISGQVRSGPGGSLRVALVGQQLAGGFQASGGTVSYSPSQSMGPFQGRVTSVGGNSVGFNLAGQGGQPVNARLVLSPSGGAQVGGTLYVGSAAPSSSQGGEGE